jgi:hypothetical protein
MDAISRRHCTIGPQHRPGPTDHCEGSSLISRGPTPRESDFFGHVSDVEHLWPLLSAAGTSARGVKIVHQDRPLGVRAEASSAGPNIAAFDAIESTD